MALSALVIVLAVGVPAPARRRHDHRHRVVPGRDLRRARRGPRSRIRAPRSSRRPMPDPTEPPRAHRAARRPQPVPRRIAGAQPLADAGHPALPEGRRQRDAPALRRDDPLAAPRRRQPWGNDGRFDLLLIGSDAGAGRWSRRNDVMLLVEVDVQVGRGRDGRPAAEPPERALPAGRRPATPSACGCQTGPAQRDVRRGDGAQPRAAGRAAARSKGIGAVRSVVRTITGRPIDAVLDRRPDRRRPGRRRDGRHRHRRPGGRRTTTTTRTPATARIKLRIKAGKQHFDGREALAYARSRHRTATTAGWQRQQTLLLAIREPARAGA